MTIDKINILKSPNSISLFIDSGRSVYAKLFYMMTGLILTPMHNRDSSPKTAHMFSLSKMCKGANVHWKISYKLHEDSDGIVIQGKS